MPVAAQPVPVAAHPVPEQPPPVDPPAREPIEAAPDEPAPIPDAAERIDSQAARWMPDDVVDGERGSILAPADGEAAGRDEPAVLAREQSPWVPEPATPARPEPAAAGVSLSSRQPAQLERAVGAYCNELLEPRLTAEATDTILSRFSVISSASDATAQELLRLTRKTAADYALAPGAWRGLTASARREECRATPARIAARDGNTLAPAARADLDAHLDECLSCQAIELRLKRAERAFTTTLTTGALDEDTSDAASGTGAGASVTAGRSAVWRVLGRRGTRTTPGWLKVAGAAGMLGALVALAGLLGAGGSNKQPTTVVQASATTRPRPATSTIVHHRARAVRRRPARHHGRTHKPAKHARPRSAGSGASAGVPSASAGPSAVSTAPASTAAPAAAAPAPARAVSSGSTGAGGSSSPAGGSSSGTGPVSVTQQGSGLPAQSAPTQGIGSGGSSGSQH